MAFDPDSLIQALRHHAHSDLPPVHRWHPDCVQDIDMRIGRDGTWFYQGSSIDRPAMVRLFSTLLRRDDDGFFLITPHEKIRVQVDLAPFIAVRMESIVETTGPAIAFQTNVGDVGVVDSDHPLWVEEDDRGPVPLIRIRDRLDALLARSVFYEIAESGTTRNVDGREMLGVVSREKFWVLGSTSE